MEKFFKFYLVFLKKEFRWECRSAESFLSALFFCLLLILVFHLAFPMRGVEAVPFVGAFVWLAALFAGTLKMSKTFEAENRGEVLGALKTINGVYAPFYLAKLTLNLLFVLASMVFLFVLASLLFDLDRPIEYFEKGWLPFFLGGVGLASVGTAFSGLIAHQTRKELLLPVMAYPILIPLIFGVLMSLEFSSSGVFLRDQWIRLLISFDVIYVVSCMMFFEIYMESF